MGKTEARLSKKEQSRLENFSVGDRVRCVIKSVDKTGKNAGVVLSRAPEVPAVVRPVTSGTAPSGDAGESAGGVGAVTPALSVIRPCTV